MSRRAIVAAAGSGKTRELVHGVLHEASPERILLTTYTDNGQTALRSAARDLIRQASEAARPTTWLRELPPLPDDEPEPLPPHDAWAVHNISERLVKGVNKGTLERAMALVLNGLATTDASQYEAALTELGRFLGSESYKPEGTGMCDSAWCWNELLWLALEAKSEQRPDGFISLADIRQANTHLPLLAHQRGLDAPPMDSATLIISPRQRVAEEGVVAADNNLYLVDVGNILAVANDVQRAWTKMLAYQHGAEHQQLTNLVTQTLSTLSLLPSQVRDRLTATPIRGCA